MSRAEHNVAVGARTKMLWKLGKAVTSALPISGTASIVLS